MMKMNSKGNRKQAPCVEETTPVLTPCSGLYILFIIIIVVGIYYFITRFDLLRFYLFADSTASCCD